MTKNAIAIFFTVLFMVMISAPSILVAIDNSFDISLFYDTPEEEKEKGNETNKNIEVLFSELYDYELGFASLFKESNLGYSLKNYHKPHLNLIPPPPETFIL